MMVYASVCHRCSFSWVLERNTRKFSGLLKSFLFLDMWDEQLWLMGTKKVFFLRYTHKYSNLLLRMHLVVEWVSNGLSKWKLTLMGKQASLPTSPPFHTTLPHLIGEWGQYNTPIRSRAWTRVLRKLRWDPEDIQPAADLHRSHGH